MHRIVQKKQLNTAVCLLELEARDIAAAAQPGQFAILRIDEAGERFPLTLYDFDRAKGTITVVCQAMGVSTRKLCALRVGEAVLDISGPLGHATETRRIGKVIVIGGGVGTAEAYPIARAMQQNGNDVTVIIGARSKELLIGEAEMRAFCPNVHLITDDGTSGRKGLVTDILRDLLDRSSYDLVFAIGPVPMMKFVAEMTRARSIRTLVSLNSIMIDGTGMCGGCRIQMKGESRFTCVDGPEFDGHRVDFEDLMRRQGQYKAQEKLALDHYEAQCRIGLTRKGS